MTKTKRMETIQPSQVDMASFRGRMKYCLHKNQFFCKPMSNINFRTNDGKSVIWAVFKTFRQALGGNQKRAGHAHLPCGFY
jgi:hypothetical protein